MVVAAFFASGFLNEATPLLIASVPVNATAPCANAFSRRTGRSTSVDSLIGRTTLALQFTAGSPTAIRMIPIAITTNAPATNKYEGSANMRPDSRMPRRLANAISDRATSARGSRCGASSGSAEVIAAMPAATLTAAVRM